MSIYAGVNDEIKLVKKTNIQRVNALTSREALKFMAETEFKFSNKKITNEK
jgi:hypothetical protein